MFSLKISDGSILFSSCVSRHVDEQTSKQGNMLYLFKICEHSLSRKANLLVNSSTRQLVNLSTVWQVGNLLNINLSYKPCESAFRF